MPDEPEKVFVHITSSTIRDDVKCEEIPDTCCGEPLESGYGFVGGGIGVYHYCTGKCGRIYKREADLEPEIETEEE